MTPLKYPEVPTVYLKPGEVVISEKPARVTTVLGSCVSVSLFNRRIGLGAISHGTMPRCRHRNRKKCDAFCDDAFRYVDCSIRYMLMVFGSLGIRNEEIEVKMFGGADTLASKRENTIGSQNVKTALDIIGMAGLKLIAADVGDSFGRKLIFFSHTGEVFLKRLKTGTKPAYAK